MKAKELFDSIVPLTPTITLLKSTGKDEMFEYPDRQELRLWSFNEAKRLQGIDFTGLRIVFDKGAEALKPIEIPIKNGLLFGDTAKVKTIYVDNR